MRKKTGYFQPSREAIIERADRIPMTAPDVLLKDILVRRKLTLLAGPSQTGKGHIEAAIAARVTNGGSHPSWPDQSPSRPGKVLICPGYEDDVSDTFIPRLKAAGANLANISFFRGFASSGQSVNINFAGDDVETIVRSISAKCPSGLDVLIVDPVFQAIEGDSTSQSAVTRALNNLAATARRLNVAVLAVTHVVKSARGRDPLGRIAGPLAYGTVARSVWVTAHNPHRNREPFDFVLLNVKSSNSKPAGGWGYSIKDIITYDEFGPREQTATCWVQRFSGRADEILQRVERNERKRSGSLDKTVNFLLAELRGKAVPYPELLRCATANGFSAGTLARAKKLLSVVSKKRAGVLHGCSIWSLPNEK